MRKSGVLHAVGCLVHLIDLPSLVCKIGKHAIRYLFTGDQCAARYIFIATAAACVNIPLTDNPTLPAGFCIFKTQYRDRRRRPIKKQPYVRSAQLRDATAEQHLCNDQPTPLVNQYRVPLPNFDEVNWVRVGDLKWKFYDR